MKTKDINVGDTLVSVTKDGAGYFRVLKVNRITVDVVGENGRQIRAYAFLFDRKVKYQVNTLP